MRLFSMLLLAIIGLVGCQSSDDEPDPGKSPGEKAAVTLPLHSYDQFDVDATTVQVGREVVLDTDGYEYNKGLDYRWVAWTGESRGERIWNSRALGDVDITQTRFSFKPKFPGLYRISWCPVISENPCVLFGELEVTGEVPVNQVPEVEFYYDNSDLVRQLCSENCKHLIDTGTAIKLNPEITDDDNVHSFNWEGNLVGVNEKVIDQNGLTADGLVFTPTEEGSYRFSMETFDEHITIDGPQKASSQWHFVARNLDNGLPEPQFFVQGFPNARASMVFQYDEAQRRYFPVINYYYEKSFTIEDCAQFPACDNDVLRFDLYQNNRGDETIPTYGVGDTVIFDGSNSHDPDGDELSYYWTSFAEYNDDTAQFLPAGEDHHLYSFTVEKAGDYFVSLCVQEKAERTLYDYANADTWPLYWVPRRRCPQIQFHVVLEG